MKSFNCNWCLEIFHLTIHTVCIVTVLWLSLLVPLEKSLQFLWRLNTSSVGSLAPSLPLFQPIFQRIHGLCFDSGSKMQSNLQLSDQPPLPSMTFKPTAVSSLYLRGCLCLLMFCCPVFFWRINIQNTQGSALWVLWC